MLWLALISIPYIIVIIIAWYSLTFRSERDKDYKYIPENLLPEITVIIAARNEERNLPHLLEDLKNLNYPAEKLEIIIVDDNSDDSSGQILKKASLSNSNLSVLSAGGEGKKAAISQGMEASKGELIMTTDADSRLQQDWLLAFATEFITKDTDVIIGQVDVEEKKGLIANFIHLEYYSLQAITGGLSLAGRPVMCNGANLGFRRSFVKNYPEDVRSDIQSGDDIFLMHSIKRRQGLISWLDDPSSIVTTRMPGTIKSLIAQRRRWASKSIYYKDADTIITGLSTLLINIALVACIFASFFNPLYLMPALAIFLSKIIPDFIILSAYLLKKQKPALLISFLPSSIIYPFYVVLTVLLSLFARRKW